MRQIILTALFLTAFIYAMGQKAVMVVKKLPDTDTPSKNSKFWDGFINNYSKGIKNKDSLSRVKFDKRTYASVYLKANGIVPNEDALSLIGYLNPDVKDSVAYGKHLNLPVFQEISRDEKRDVRLRFKDIEKFDRDANEDFKMQVTRFNANYTRLKAIKLTGIPKEQLNDLETTYNKLHEFLNPARSGRPSKGSLEIMSKNLVVINKLTEKLITDPRISKNDYNLIMTSSKNVFGKTYILEQEAMRIKMMGFHNYPARKKSGVNYASGENEYREENNQNVENSFYFEVNNEVNKVCYIYALSTDDSTGSLVEFKNSYHFAYLDAAPAAMAKLNNDFSGFTDQDQDVSYCYITMPIGDYVFRFTDKNTGIVHWRCYPMDSFIIKDAQGRDLGINTVKLIFNPRVASCQNWIW